VGCCYLDVLDAVCATYIHWYSVYLFYWYKSTNTGGSALTVS
jgi:hypothetical protein